MNIAIALLLTYLVADFALIGYLYNGKVLFPLLPLVVILIMFYKYKSHLAYVMILSICFASILYNAHFLPDNWYELLRDKGNNSLFSPFGRICWPCEIVSFFKSFLVGFVLIALLHSRAIATKYQWNIQSFFLAIANGFILFLLMKWSFI